MMEAAPLPSFVLRRSQGLFVDPCGTDCGERFVAFVDQVFGNDALFRDLDYANFERLLYGPWSAPGESPPILLATGIRDFSEERRQLYKALAVSEDGARAEYLFEAVFIDAEETSNEEPADGSRPGSAAPEPATLEFDEFVAHLWSGGVRFGIDAARVRKAIGSAERGRLVVANEREPRPGCDAGIEDKSRSLRRDNSPTRLGNGQHDLGSFKNRFPQVRKNEPLLRKTPRIPGEPGRKVSGEIVEPGIPEDFDLDLMAGPGTRIERRTDGQYIVSTMSGFVDIDKNSNRISISEKMIGREGVSMHATGNLRLMGDDYEEYGEVEAQRMVEGKNMTFHAAVHGNLISRGGLVCLEQNLDSGKITNPGGEIVVKGRVSASVLEATGGTIRLCRAEGCVISATRVEIEHAVCCEIIAAEVDVSNSEGCTIAAQSAAIKTASAHKRRETVVSMLVPNDAENAARQAEVETRLGETQSRIEEAAAARVAVESGQEYAGYLNLQAKIARGEIKISAAQADGLRKLIARFAAQTQQLRVLAQKHDQLLDEQDNAKAQLASLKNDSTSAMASKCEIAEVTGETVVQLLHYSPEKDFLAGAALEQVRTRLRTRNMSHQRLFFDDTGSFSWQYASAAKVAEDEVV